MFEDGALPGRSVREAVSSSPLILLTLTDYAAVQQCLNQLDTDLSGRTDAAMILYSGPRHAFEQHKTTLELLSLPRFVGEAPEAAAIWDLALFGVW